MTPKMGQLHSNDNKKTLNWTAETPTSNHTETIKRLERMTFRISLNSRKHGYLKLAAISISKTYLTPIYPPSLKPIHLQCNMLV